MRGYQRGIWLREIKAIRAVTVPGEGSGAPGRPGRPGRRGSAFSRPDRPEFCQKFPCPPNRGRRERRMRAAPAVSCAMCTRRCAHEHTGSAEAIRHSLRNGFTAYIALSPVTGFVATVAGGIPRSIQLDRCATANLTPASGRQDHTTSPSASRTVRQRRIHVHRTLPRVRDDREPPL